MSKLKDKKKKSGMNPHELKNRGKSNDSGKVARSEKIKRKPIGERLLTLELIREFEKLLPQVFYLETVAACLNVNRVTWRLWLARGRAEADRLSKDEEAEEKVSEVLYLRFYMAYKSAIARGKTNLLNIIASAAQKQWTAAAWLLERRFPNEWSQDKQEMRDIKKKIQELEEIQLKHQELNGNGKDPIKIDRNRSTMPYSRPFSN